MMGSQNGGSSPPRSGGEVARAKPETERGSAADVPSRRSPEKIARARELRHGDNSMEATLWNELKAKRLAGYKFVRQMPIGPYFADFAAEAKSWSLNWTEVTMPRVPMTDDATNSCVAKGSR